MRYHCMKKKIYFVLHKFVKRTEKILFSLVFTCFCFTEVLYFVNFPSNENVRKQHLSANVYSCVNMKLLYAIAVHKKIKILCRIVTKTSDFLVVFRSTFCRQYLSEKWNFLRYIAAKKSKTFRRRCLYLSANILQETWWKNRGCIFFSFVVINALSL